MSIDLSGEALHIYKHVGNSKNAEEPDELKMSILLELFLTAADVSHNLQGWGQMVKWSNCLYLELQRALLSGRGTDPQPNWFQNQVRSMCLAFDMILFRLSHLFPPGFLLRLASWNSTYYRLPIDWMKRVSSVALWASSLPSRYWPIVIGG